MTYFRRGLMVSFALLCANAHAQVVEIGPRDLHVEALRPKTYSYLVYNSAPAKDNVQLANLATVTLSSQRIEGKQAWVIEQAWRDERGTSHTAHTVHAADDLSTLSQKSHWRNARGTYDIELIGQGLEVAGPASREEVQKMYAGVAAASRAWWLNWHSDLVLLPLLPFERGGTLRVRLFDVGMPDALHVDYVVKGEFVIEDALGEKHVCWLVETESGAPGQGNVQRFWIDKQTRTVMKQEDLYQGNYRDKYLLSVPVSRSYPVSTTR